MSLVVKAAAVCFYYLLFDEICILYEIQSVSHNTEHMFFFSVLSLTHCLVSTDSDGGTRLLPRMRSASGVK